MFECWYLVKFDYVSPVTQEAQTKIQGYERLEDANSIFKKLELSYQFDVRVRSKDDKLVKVTGVWLYQAFKFYLYDAVNAVKSGDADLMYEARGVEIDIEH